MKIRDNLPKLFVIAFFVGGIGIGISKMLKSPDQSVQVKVIVPQLSPLAQQGEKAFAVNCATCHGVNGSGTQQGPPLVHDIYNPGHHPDGAFFSAAKKGVPQHHWAYGNMPAQPQADESDLRAIVQYVRELQVANGVVTRKHTM